MLKYLVRHYALQAIKLHGGNRDVLLREEILFSIIPLARQKYDELRDRDPREYIWYHKTSFHPKFEPLLLTIKDEVYENFGIKKFDNNFSLVDKKQFLINSITAVKLAVEEIKREYKEDYLENRNSILDNITYNLEAKLDDKKEVVKILKSVEKIKMNFLLESIHGKIYPIVADMLEDVVTSEFSMALDKDLIRKIIETWKEAEIAQKRRKFFSNLSFENMKFIEQIKYKNIRRFLLAEYARTIHAEEKDVQKFMQHMLYYDTAMHKHTPGLNFRTIDEMEPRAFLLNRTKTVIGEL